MKSLTSYFMLLVVCCAVPAFGLDKSPDPVDEAILKNPQPRDLPTLIGALNGSGCRPKHSDVGDALVQIGKPSIEPLVKRLNSTTKWWIQLECVHLLGLIGPEAAARADDVEEWMTSGPRHGLPKSYAALAVAAMRSDTDALIEAFAGHGSRAEYASELLVRFDELAKKAEPALKKLAGSEEESRAVSYARETLEGIAKSRAAKKSRPQTVADNSQSK